jgi:hypothetical protein
MKFLPLVAALLFSNAVCQDKPKELGIGLVVSSNPYQFENGSHFADFFTDKTLKTKADTPYYKEIHPYLYKPDYGLYHFICISKSEKFYEILINNSVKGYIPNSESFYFISWESLLINKTLERLSKDNTIHTKPSNESEVMEYTCNPDRLRVESVIEKNNEYWISVAYSSTCEDLNEAKSWNNGWIKWRLKNDLLVNIFFLC